MNKTFHFLSSTAQRGWMAVAAIAPALIGFVSYALFQYSNLENAKYQGQLADESGRILQQHTFGVMKLISEMGGSTPVAAQTGSQWLKANTCAGGTAARAYIANCGFPDGIPMTQGASFNTTFTIDATTNVVTAETRVPWPRLQNASNKKSPNVAASVRASAASYFSGSTPISQTFVEYSLDRATEEIVAVITTAPSTDIWIRSDGSNQMNDNLNIGGNDVYGVSNIFGAATATSDLATTVTIGSALTSEGTITAEGIVRVTGVSSTAVGLVPAGTSIHADGDIYSGGDIYGEDAYINGDISLGDFSSSTVIRFNSAAAGSLSNITMTSDASGDLRISNGVGGSGDATVIADKIYIEQLNRFVSQGVYDVTMVSSGESVIKPICPGGQTPQIFTGVSGIGEYLSRPIRAFDVAPLDLGDRWQVNVVLLTESNTQVATSEMYTDILVMTKCT